MSRHEIPKARAERRPRIRNHGALNAAHVGNDCRRRQCVANFLQYLSRGSDRHRNNHHVGVADGGRCAVCRTVDHAEPHGFAQILKRSPVPDDFADARLLA